MTTENDVLVMAALSVFILWAVLAMASRAAAKVVPSFEDLPSPYRQLLPRNYDGGWRTKPALRGWAPLAIATQVVWVAAIQGIWTVLAFHPRNVLIPPRGDDIVWRLPAAAETVVALILLARLLVIARSLRHGSGVARRSTAKDRPKRNRP